MIDMSWHWTILSFAAAFYSSWLGFALLWYVVALVHGMGSQHSTACYGNSCAGDLEEDKDPDTVCVENLHDFASCFLFSLETQHTIG